MIDEPFEMDVDLDSIKAAVASYIDDAVEAATPGWQKMTAQEIRDEIDFWRTRLRATKGRRLE